MSDLPAPQHSEALNRMLGLPPVRHPEPAQPEAVSRLELDARRRALRRQAAERSRARREAA
jgi:hypothetical protein